jgi:hypothetical protein
VISRGPPTISPRLLVFHNPGLYDPELCLQSLVHTAEAQEGMKAAGYNPATLRRDAAGDPSVLRVRGKPGGGGPGALTAALVRLRCRE